MYMNFCVAQKENMRVDTNHRQQANYAYFDEIPRGAFRK